MSRKSLMAPRRILFVSRFPQSLDLRLWLKDIPNSYVHFGDFDIYGIQIFLTEFQKYLGERSSFLIPVDIEERLKTALGKDIVNKIRNQKTYSQISQSFKG